MNEFDTLPSLAGPTPTARHVFDANCLIRSTRRLGSRAGQPGEEEQGNDRPTRPAHGETLFEKQWFAMPQGATVTPMPQPAARKSM